MARMTRAEANWDRLLHALLHYEQTQGRAGAEGYGGDLAGFAPPSLGQTSNIDDILLVANQIQAEDPNVARILCEHAYSLAQNLDPNSEGRGVLQFKTGLMSVIKQKLAKKEGERIDRSQDISRIQDFYKYYRRKHNVDELQEQERKWRESGSYDIDPNELERRTVQMRKVYATLRVLKEVLDALTRDTSEADQLVSEELRKVMASDAARTEEYRAYNILPLDAPGVSDIIVILPEVRAAISALEYSELPTLPDDFDMPKQRHLDIFDVLQYIFGFQKDNASNQREHFVLLLANAQSRLSVPSDADPQLDETAINKVYEKILDNYNKWCKYIRITSKCRDATTRKKKLVLVSLYLLIWGESANIRFLPECICYIFHNMAAELGVIFSEQIVHQAKSCKVENTCSFLTQIISPVYTSIAAEAAKNSNATAAHSAWRNYDDFNEFFWSRSCFDELQWPWRLDAAFFSPRHDKDAVTKWSRSGTRMGKTNFVEHRTFLHLYHSFHRLWIFFVLMFQGLTLLAFSSGLNLYTFKNLLSLGPSFVVMKLFESILDIILMYGAYRSSRGRAIARIFLRFMWFGGSSGVLCFLYFKVLQERSKHPAQSTFFAIYLWVLGAYAVFQIFVTVLMRVPFIRVQANKCDNWDIIQFLKWLHQEHYFVGRGLYERMRDYLRYSLYWLIVLGCKFTFSYFLQIKPLVAPTRTIVNFGDIKYSWHDFVSKHNHNALAVASFWLPVALVYFMDISVWHTIFSAIVGGLIGARERLGEIRSLNMLQKRFQSFPDAFVSKLQPSMTRMIRTVSVQDQAFEIRAKGNAARFAPLWNEIIKCLREEDYINNREKELLLMPMNKSDLTLVQWPLFLLASKVFLAMDLAAENKDNQNELWERIKRDEYMSQAVQEAYHSLAGILNVVLVNDEARKWVGNMLGDVEASIQEGSFMVNFQTKKLAFVVSRITALTGLLIHDETPERAKGLVKAMQDFYDAVTHDVLSTELREKYDTWDQLATARSDGRLFSRLSWPTTREQRDQIKRLHLLLTIKDSAANVPKNLEAQRRLQFFTNSLFMNIPKPQPVRLMMSFSVFTPYYSEIVMYSKDELRKENEDGISTIFYLQKIFPDEWRNFLERVGRTEATLETELTPGSSELRELRLWASYRGQTLARTVRGMMYYRRALMLQSFLEQSDTRDIEDGIPSSNHEGYGASRGARAQADLKFTYVITCQIYGQQKQKKDQRAADILFLMQKHEALRIAFIDTTESFKEGKVYREFFSKLVKADINGKDQEIYSIKLPGDPKLGEGKPENQNHAIIFTRGDAIQTIDMNQDNYFEEALKMRNLLEEFNCDHGLRPPSILGVREHVFTGSVSSLAWFMSNQETTFVTLGQRVLASPLKVRMHYGHPDVFDRLFHVTRGGISKASRVINISEDIFAGFNSTLRQGNITQHEYIQVGKGRDVGLNQIALFEAKVSSGNGEQSLSRDVYRLGQLFDFFRMLSFFVTAVGYYVCTMMTTLTVYAFLYGKAYLALSGVGAALENRAEITNNTSLQSALNTQFLVQIGVFTAIPMIMGFILEQGVLKAIVSFITMQLQLCSVFFTFSLGTRTHYFGRTILHGGAKYRATGRGFVVQHIRFAENYRLYSRSHFVKALEVVMLLVVYLAYGFDNKSAVSYILLSFSSWFLAISWLFAPYIFNPSGFEWQKTVDDFDDWTNWLLYKGGVGVKGEESWEAWWDEEHEHIRSLRGRILETILSIRFFIFQYGVVYRLNAAGGSTSLSVYGISWLILAGAVLIFKVFTFSQKASVNFQMLLRLIQGAAFILIISGLVVIVALTKVTVGDIFATSLALIPTGWGFLSIALAWKPIIRKSGLWKSVRSIARFYDAIMGIVIFVPIAVLSWFPFVSTFQTRLLYNQAFSRGLEISLILAGNRPNAQV